MDELGGGGGYYSFVVVTLPLSRCPQTLHQTHEKSLLEYFRMLHVYLYRREDSWEERWVQSDIWLSTQPPPPPLSQNCIFLALWSMYEKLAVRLFPCIHSNVCSMIRFSCTDNLILRGVLPWMRVEQITWSADVCVLPIPWQVNNVVLVCDSSCRDYHPTNVTKHWACRREVLEYASWCVIRKVSCQVS